MAFLCSRESFCVFWVHYLLSIFSHPFRAWLMETGTKQQGSNLASRPRAVSQVRSQNQNLGRDSHPPIPPRAPLGGQGWGWRGEVGEMGVGGGKGETGLGVGGMQGKGTVQVPLRHEGRFCSTENFLPSGMWEEQVSLQSRAMHHFLPVQKKKRQKHICLSWLVFWPRPKTFSSVSKGSDRMGGCRSIHLSRNPENLSQLWLGPFSENRPILMIPWTGVTPEVSLKGSSCRSLELAPAAARGPPQPAGRPAVRQVGAIVCGHHPHSPPAGPRRIASFKCRKLSSQVRVFDLPGVSLYWMVICSTHSIPIPIIIPIPLSPHPISPPWDCPFGTAWRKGAGGGEGGRGTNSPVSGQRSLLLFVTQETRSSMWGSWTWVEAAIITWHLPLHGRRFSFLPAFRETEKEGGAELSSGVGRLFSHLNRKHSIGHGGSPGVGWGWVGWGQRPTPDPSSSLLWHLPGTHEKLSWWLCVCVRACTCVRERRCMCMCVCMDVRDKERRTERKEKK